MTSSLSICVILFFKNVPYGICLLFAGLKNSALSILSIMLKIEMRLKIHLRALRVTKPYSIFELLI